MTPEGRRIQRLRKAALRYRLKYRAADMLHKAAAAQRPDSWDDTVVQLQEERDLAKNQALELIREVEALQARCDIYRLEQEGALASLQAEIERADELQRRCDEYRAEREDARDAVDIERKRADSYVAALKNLLARIHRDGGERQEEIGDLFKAAEDADSIVANLYVERGELQAALTKLQIVLEWK